ncbi:hypothetical protein MRX96_007590 [Rhipicephalus microplus]
MGTTKHGQKELQQRYEALQQQYKQLQQQARKFQESVLSDTDAKNQWLSKKNEDLQKEVESLNVVLEMRANQIQNLQHAKIELERKEEKLDRCKREPRGTEHPVVHWTIASGQRIWLFPLAERVTFCFRLSSTAHQSRPPEVYDEEEEPRKVSVQHPFLRSIRCTIPIIMSGLKKAMKFIKCSCGTTIPVRGQTLPVKPASKQHKRLATRWRDQKVKFVSLMNVMTLCP